MATSSRGNRMEPGGVGRVGYGRGVGAGDSWGGVEAIALGGARPATVNEASEIPEAGCEMEMVLVGAETSRPPAPTSVDAVIDHVRPRSVERPGAHTICRRDGSRLGGGGPIAGQNAHGIMVSHRRCCCLAACQKSPVGVVVSVPHSRRDLLHRKSDPGLRESERE